LYLRDINISICRSVDFSKEQHDKSVECTTGDLWNAQLKLGEVVSLPKDGSIVCNYVRFLEIKDFRKDMMSHVFEVIGQHFFLLK